MDNKLKIANKTENGFTLIEIIITIFCFVLIAWGLIGLVSNIFFSANQQSGLLAISDQARKLSSQMVYEIRDAQTPPTGAYILDTAGDQQLIFYSNSDIDSAIERIRYFVKNGQLWKGITEYSGSGYSTSTEKTALVLNNLANGSSPVFYYYDGSFTGSSTQSSLVQPVSVTAVKFIKVNLQIYNKAGVNNANTYNVTASAAIRNLKTNLGQ